MACSWIFFCIYYIKNSICGRLEINKRGGSNKACSWENLLKNNKKKFMLIRDFRVYNIQVLVWHNLTNNVKHFKLLNYIHYIYLPYARNYNPQSVYFSKD